MSSTALPRAPSAGAWGRRLRFLLLAFGVWFGTIGAALELGLPLLNKKYDRFFKHDIVSSQIDKREIQNFLESDRFDAELGWDPKPIARNYAVDQPYFGQSYGDSFVAGATEVADTWQAHFERLTGKTILNLGVPGYGLDQAVLKYEKYGSRYRTRVAILGLYTEEYRRTLSYHSFYYFPNRSRWTFVFKPLFITKEQRFQLVSPPCAEVGCFLDILSNPQNRVRDFVSRYDYWYRVNAGKPAEGFPNIVSYARVGSALFRERREREESQHRVFVNDHSLELAKYLVRRFVRDTEQTGQLPVLVLLYSPRDLQLIRRGVRLDEAMLSFLASNGIHYIDTGRYIVERSPNDNNFDSLSLPDGHLNSLGNQMVAAALASEFERTGLLKR